MAAQSANLGLDEEAANAAPHILPASRIARVCHSLWIVEAILSRSSWEEHSCVGMRGSRSGVYP